MKSKGTLIAFLTFFIIALVSCINKNSENEEKASADDNIVDTQPKLKFSSGIRSIFEDSKGNFWFGSHNEGVARFDGQRFIYFTTQDGLSHNQVRSIREDATGTIWFECGVGLSKYTNYMIVTDSKRDYSKKAEWSTSPNDLWFKGDEMTGFSTQEGQPGAYRYDGNNLIFQAFPVELDNNELSMYSVTSPIFKGKNNTVWFATYGAVIGYNENGFTIIDNERLSLNETTGYLHVRSLFEDSKGNLWIGNNGIGLLKFDGDTVVNFSQQNGLVDKNSKHNGSQSPPGTLEHVFAIAEDKDGNIWFGDRDTGAWRYDGSSFTNFTLADGLTSNHVWTFYRDKKGQWWTGLDDGGVFKFDGEKFEKAF